jgi:hypothetical protein
LLLCERALWPGKANAQPPVSRELIGSDGVLQSGACMRLSMQVAGGGQMVMAFIFC